MSLDERKLVLKGTTAALGPPKSAGPRPRLRAWPKVGDSGGELEATSWRLAAPSKRPTISSIASSPTLVALWPSLLTDLLACGVCTLVRLTGPLLA